MATGKLPVIATAVEAIKFPLRYPWEFIRFGCLTLGLSLLMGWLDSSASTPREHPVFEIVGALVFLLGLLASTFVIAPFEVTWIRLTLNGPSNVTDRPIWVFGKAERQLLIAELVLFIPGAPGILAFIVALIVHQVTALLVVMLFATAGLLIAGFGCSIRLSFILIEVALQRYGDWRTSWNQTRGCIWRLIGIGLLASLPYGIVGSLLGGWIFFEHASALVMIGGEVVEVLLTFAGVSAGWSALALAYRFTAAEPSQTVTVATS